MCGVHLIATSHNQLCAVNLILTHSPTDSLPHNPRQMHNDGRRWSNSGEVLSTGVQQQRPHHTKPSLSPFLSLYLSRCLCVLFFIPPSLSLGVAQHRVLAPFSYLRIHLPSHPYKSARTKLNKCQDCRCIRLAHTIKTNTAFF